MEVQSSAKPASPIYTLSFFFGPTAKALVQNWVQYNGLFRYNTCIYYLLGVRYHVAFLAITHCWQINYQGC
jgi:hypothetical protein